MFILSKIKEALILRNPIHAKISMAAIVTYIPALLLILIQNPTIITNNVPATYGTLILGIIILIYNLITPGLVNSSTDGA
jgi:hypothetical protein